MKYSLFRLKKAFKLLRKDGARRVITRLAEIVTDSGEDYDRWARLRQPSAEALAAQRGKVFPYMPLLSIVVPVYNTKPSYLSAAIESVLAQTYSAWELCLADGHSPNQATIDCLRAYEKKDSRVRVLYSSENGGISANTNLALGMARGDYVAFMDHDDLLTPDALYEVVRSINETGADFLYSDEDQTDESASRFFNPHFKPDYAPDHLESCNYICHLHVVRKALLDEVGPLDPACDGSQDHDLDLRIVEKTDRIAHIDKVLYHWRQFASSTSHQGLIRCKRASRRAVAAHILRTEGLECSVTSEHVNRVVRPLPDPLPSVSLIVEHDGPADRLDGCLNSIRACTHWPRLEVIVACHPDAALPVLPPETRVIKNDSGRFQLLNQAANTASGDFLMFLDSGVRVTANGWLEELVMFAQRKRCGAVAPTLLTEENLILMMGYLVGMEQTVARRFAQGNLSAPSYQLMTTFPHNVSAASAAAMMIRRGLFGALNGFDQRFSSDLGDVDLCLRALNKGYFSLVTPYARLQYLPREQTAQAVVMEAPDKSDQSLFCGLYPDLRDRFYNRNLTRADGSFSLAAPELKKG